MSYGAGVNRVSRTRDMQTLRRKERHAHIQTHAHAETDTEAHTHKHTDPHKQAQLLYPKMIIHIYKQSHTHMHTCGHLCHLCTPTHIRVHTYAHALTCARARFNLYAQSPTSQEQRCVQRPARNWAAQGEAMLARELQVFGNCTNPRFSRYANLFAKLFAKRLPIVRRHVGFEKKQNSYLDREISKLLDGSEGLAVRAWGWNMGEIRSSCREAPATGYDFHSYVRVCLFQVAPPQMGLLQLMLL